jgi:flagellar hook assembly protein FlgD
MARLQLYQLGAPQEALAIAYQLKIEAMQQSGDIISTKPVQAEALAFLGECQRYLGYIDDAYNSFCAAEKIFIELEELYGNSWLWGIYHLPIAIIQYHIGEIEFQYQMFESGRKRFDNAFKLFTPDISGDDHYTSVIPRHYERNNVYKKLAAEKTKITIDKQKSTQFFFPGKVTAKIYYRFKYVPPKNNNVSIYIKISVLKVDSLEEVYTQIIENPQESEEICFEWTGMDEYQLPVKKGDYKVVISYHKDQIPAKNNEVFSADYFFLKVGCLWINKSKSTVNFALKEKEPTECLIAYELYFPELMKKNVFLEISIKNTEGVQIHKSNLYDLNEGSEVFKWNLIYKNDENTADKKTIYSEINPGEYFVTLTLKSNGSLPVKNDIAIVTENFEALYIDLDIVPYGIDYIDNNQTVDELIEETEGEILQVNFDDDDFDGHPSNTYWGKNPIVDISDGNGVENENDLLQIIFHSIYGKNVETPVKSPKKYFAKINYSYEYFRLWKNKNKTGLIYSGDVYHFDITKDTVAYLEAIAVTKNDNNQFITVKLIENLDQKEDSSGIETDTVKVTNPKMIFALFGDDATASKRYLLNYLNAKTISNRTDPYIINDNNHSKSSYSVFVYPPNNCNSPERAQNYMCTALFAPGAIVTFDGHSNFGMGLSFFKNKKNISDFYNLGTSVTAIDWLYMRDVEDGQGHPEFTVHSNEYFYSNGPWRGIYLVKGFLEKDYPAYHYDIYQRTKEWVKLTFEDVDEEYCDHHIDPTDEDFNLYELIVVKTGPSQLPDLNYKKLFLRTCTSGDHYYDSFFVQGTFFYSKSLVSPINYKMIQEFIQTCIQTNENDEELINCLNKRAENKPEIYDYFSLYLEEKNEN